MELWYPGAKQEILNNAGAFIENSKWKGVLHTTEGPTYSGALGAYKANNSAPHFTVSYEGNQFQAWQHIALNRAARSLQNLPGGVETNRLKVIQIEIVWKASEAHLMPRGLLDGLGKLMRWVEKNTTLVHTKPTKPFATQYGQKERRFTNQEWVFYSGWCGHSHVPENSHWDPGSIDIDYLLQVGVEVKPMFDPAECFAYIRTDPTNGGWIAVKSDGAIFNGEGSVWYGGMNGSPHFVGRKAAKILFPGDADWPNDGLAYKYRIVATSGEVYGIG